MEAAANNLKTTAICLLILTGGLPGVLVVE
jgi:hypothetical protein